VRDRHYDVVQLSQPSSYLAARALRKDPRGPLSVWRSHGLEAKVDEALANHAAALASGPRAAMRALVARRLHWAQAEAVKWCEGIVVPCHDDKEFLVDRFGADERRVRVVWHGVPDEFLDHELRPDPNRWRRLLHVSQMSANKGPAVMLEVVTNVLTEVPEAELTWLCPQELHAGLAATLPARLLARISFRSWVDRRDLLGLYDSHGVFLFPTLAEGAAKVVMEAMSRGMCVVSSDTSGPRDYLRQGANGYLVPVGDSAAMAANAVALLRRPVEAEHVGRAARKTAGAFRWSRCAEELTGFYGELARMRESAA
jgi:glycosyltransferase involved in cell wall biosynthesis